MKIGQDGLFFALFCILTAIGLLTLRYGLDTIEYNSKVGLITIAIVALILAVGCLVSFVIEKVSMSQNIDETKGDRR